MKKLLAAAGIAALLTGAFVQPATALNTTTTPLSWGLDRIDQIFNDLDGSYTRPESGGVGVRVYVLDTGVQGDLLGFEGRVEAGFDATTRFGGRADTDCNGHGTHVAGIIASSKYGIAPRATIVPVKVADCRGGLLEGSVITALNWVSANHPVGVPAVLNMSFALNHSKRVNDLTNSLHQAGIVITAAAGNFNFDACRISPGSSEAILTVGSINMNTYKTNGTTHGSCIDIYAPGGLIVSEDPRSESRTRSGTSMAAPHVAGAAALYLSEHPRTSAETFNNLVKIGATQNAVVNVTSGSNLLLNIGFINGSSTGESVSVVDPPVSQDLPLPLQLIADAPTKLLIGGGSSALVATWTSPSNLNRVELVHYRIESSRDNGRSWSVLARVAPTETQALVGRAVINRLISFRIFAVTASGDSQASSKVSIRISR